MSYCKYLGQEVNLGTWWCNRQFDKDFLKMLNQKELDDALDIIYRCNCDNCSFKEPALYEMKATSENSVVWEKVSEI